MRKYVIFPYADINDVNFNEVLENNIDTLRLSNDGLLTIIKWNDDTGSYVPAFVQKFSQYDGPYTQEEMIEIMQTSNWI